MPNLDPSSPCPGRDRAVPAKGRSGDDSWESLDLVATGLLGVFLPNVETDPERNHYLFEYAKAYAEESLSSSPQAAENGTILLLAEALRDEENGWLRLALTQRARSQLIGIELRAAMEDRTLGSPLCMSKFGTLESALALMGERLLTVGRPDMAIAPLTLALLIYHFQEQAGARVASLITQDFRNLSRAFHMLAITKGEDGLSAYADQCLRRAKFLESREIVGQ